ncbi:MAG: hypothetical protein EOP86_21860 [Verrucomicrobiaceae bacterium]|nr:MAG: hypothetical protein EOP86_21860 [Verrucomicrobiaceae bacterium]
MAKPVTASIPPPLSPFRDAAADLVTVPTVETLPAILRGIPELVVYLKLPEDFVRTWVAGGNALTPAMPHFKVGAGMNFVTTEVIRWLAQYHGWGGMMKDPATRVVRSKVKCSA